MSERFGPITLPSGSVLPAGLAMDPSPSPWYAQGFTGVTIGTLGKAAGVTPNPAGGSHTAAAFALLLEMRMFFVFDTMRMAMPVPWATLLTDTYFWVPLMTELRGKIRLFMSRYYAGGRLKLPSIQLNSEATQRSWQYYFPLMTTPNIGSSEYAYRGNNNPDLGAFECFVLYAKLASRCAQSGGPSGYASIDDEPYFDKRQPWSSPGRFAWLDSSDKVYLEDLYSPSVLHPTVQRVAAKRVAKRKTFLRELTSFFNRPF